MNATSRSIASVFFFLSSILAIPAVGAALFGAWFLFQDNEPGFGAIPLVVAGAGLWLLQGYSRIRKEQATWEEERRTWISSAIFNGLSAYAAFSIEESVGWFWLWPVALVLAAVGSVAGAIACYRTSD